MNTYIALMLLDVSSGFIHPGETIALSDEIAEILVAHGAVTPLDHTETEEATHGNSNNRSDLLS